MANNEMKSMNTTIKIGKIGLPKLTRTTPLLDITHIRCETNAYASLISNSHIGNIYLDKLNKDPRITGIKEKMLMTGLSGQRISVKDVCIWFLWYANENGIDKAESVLNNFLDLQPEELTATVWVHGIFLDNTIDLGDGYSIVPINSLPDSEHKNIFLSSSTTHYPQSLASPPQVALTKKVLMNRVRDNWDTPLDDCDPVHSAFTKIDDIILLINSLNKCVCFSYLYTCYAYDAVAPLSGSGYSAPHHDIYLGCNQKVDSDKVQPVKQLIKQFEQYPEQQKKILRVALYRLSRAKVQKNIENRFVDLGIILEMLLLNDNPKDNIAALLRKRGADLISSSSKERRKNRNALNDIYEYRSQIVHTGAIGNNSQEDIKKAAQNFPKYLELVENIIHKLLEAQSFNWKQS